MKIITNYVPPAISATKTQGIDLSKNSQFKTIIEEEEEKKDKFKKRNSQPEADMSYTQYPHGSLEYIMAVYNLMNIKLPKYSDTTGDIGKKQHHLIVEKSEPSAPSNNRETFSYNQQDKSDNSSEKKSKEN